MGRMDKSKRSFPFSQLIKKSTLAGLIFILSWTLFQIVDHFQPSQPIKIPSSNAPVELYSNQTKDDLSRIYVEAIDQAHESVILAIYSLTDQRVLQALKRKAASGIPVYIVCDAEACKEMPSNIPKAIFIKRRGKGLMHQKILIIDQKQIWLGSANLTFSSLDIHGNLIVGIENPSLAEALAKRTKSMDFEGGRNPLFHLETVAGPQHVELWILPDDPHAVKRLIDLFRSAKKTIKVAMFAWTRTDFAQELIAASKRGVKVEVILDRNLGNGAGAKIVRILNGAGISVRLSTGKGLLHHKFAYIDDRILVNGSANWTTRAFKDNDDDFLIIYPLTAEQQIKMSQLFTFIQKQSKKPGND
jgi:phosphatidylserine/phosphatidylglycerophosphate/cardiolipin synthase-like enzyme